MRIEGFIAVLRKKPEKFPGIPFGCPGLDAVETGVAPRADFRDQIADGGKTGRIVGHAIIGDPADPGMHARPAEALVVDLLADGSLHQMRARQEDAAGAVHDHRLVAHDRQIGATRDAEPHDGGDLHDAARRHHGVVSEYPAEMLLVRKNLVLHGKKHARGIDEIHDGQGVFEGDLLCPEVFLHGDRKPGACLDGGIVGNDDAIAPVDFPDAENGSRRRCPAVFLVHAIGGEKSDFEEVAALVDERRNSFARRELPAAVMPFDRLGAAAELDLFFARRENAERVFVRVFVFVKLRSAGVAHSCGYQICDR